MNKIDKIVEIILDGCQYESCKYPNLAAYEAWIVNRNDAQILDYLFAHVSNSNLYRIDNEIETGASLILRR